MLIIIIGIGNKSDVFCVGVYFIATSNNKYYIYATKLS